MLATNRISTYIYIIEFPKRGLFHAYILFILNSKNRFFIVDKINIIINVEIFNQILYSNLYAIVTKYMLYNNCNYYVINQINIVLSCWDSNKNQYNKRFSKKFCDHIIFKSDFEYLKYRRRKSFKISKNDFKQNCWIIFYNLYFSIKYDVYINVKIYANVKICKCIFKYVYKNNDRINFRMKRERNAKDDIK